MIPCVVQVDGYLGSRANQLAIPRPRRPNQTSAHPSSRLKTSTNITEYLLSQFQLDFHSNHNGSSTFCCNWRALLLRSSTSNLPDTRHSSLLVDPHSQHECRCEFSLGKIARFRRARCLFESGFSSIQSWWKTRGG